jgi:glyoxylase-like metal-dependent hydrolase (beta-lactamase superfamily II)
MVNKVIPIKAGYIMMDGGTMFGTLPKKNWNEIYPSNLDNKNKWALNCLYIEDDKRKILIDTGYGKNLKIPFFIPENEDDVLSIDSALDSKDINPNNITDVILTHLHFDHCGGALKLDEDGHKTPTFPNATYWVHKKHYDYARKPTLKEKASFLPDTFGSLQDLGVLRFLDFEDSHSFSNIIELFLSHGHTQYLMVPKIRYENKLIVHVSDIVPSHFHVSLRRSSSFDNNSFQLTEEKKSILTEISEHPNGFIHFGHDPYYSLGRVKKIGEDFKFINE